MKEYLNINFSDIVYGENGFLVELRCNNIFHEQLFGEIKTYLHKKETEWKVRLPLSLCSKSQNSKEEDVYACQRIYGIIF